MNTQAQCKNSAGSPRMPNFFRRSVCIFLAALSSAIADMATKPSLTGSFASDDDVQTFQFTVTETTEVVLRTWSFAGGINAAGNAIPPGGFAPVLSLFNGTGAQHLLVIDRNGGTGSSAPRPVDTVSGFAWDGYLRVTLRPGDYILTLSQDDNLPVGPGLANGFFRHGQGNFTGPTYRGSAGSFVLADRSQRTGNWAVDLSVASAAPDTTPPGVVLIAPNGGETLYAGTSFAIQWASADDVGVVSHDVLLSTDSGVTYPTVIASALPGTASSFTWIPSSAGTGRRIKVVARDAAGNVGSKNSASNLSVVIGTPGISVTGPNTAVNWGIGTAQKISWSSNVGSASKVDIDLSTDGGISYGTLAAAVANTGSFTWNVTAPPTTTALIRVKWTNNYAVADTSNVAFTIAAPFLALTKPNGGENWAAGSAQSFTWSSNLGSSENVSIELSTDAGATYQILKASTPSDGSDTNTLASSLSSSSCVARITWLKNPAIKDASNAPFSVAPAYINLTAPNGGDRWFVGTNRTITWQSNLGGSKTIELSTDGGMNWQTLVPTTTSSGSVSVAVPNQPSVNCKVRVSSLAAGFTGIQDTSDAVFQIAQPFVTVNVPNGGENWVLGTVHPITWSSNVTGNIKIEVSRDGGTTWSSVVSSVANTGTYNWTVTAPPSTNGLIRITSVSFPSTADTSDAGFAIAAPTVAVVAPNGGESWVIGASKAIQWSFNGAGNVKIEVSRNGGATWTLIASSVANTGSYDWTVASPASTNCRIRITSVSFPTSSATSGAVFTIQ